MPAIMFPHNKTFGKNCVFYLCEASMTTKKCFGVTVRLHAKTIDSVCCDVCHAASAHARIY